MREPELLVKGEGRYVDDISLPDMLYMSVVRSPYARARLLKVEGGINHQDLDVPIGGYGEGASREVDIKLLHPVFAKDYVYYAGQPVAAVLGEDRYKAVDKLEEVEVEYEPLQPMMTIEEALSGEPIHVDTDSNIIRRSWMGEEFKDPDSPVVLEDEFRIGRVKNNPIETRGIVASFEGSRLTVQISTQAVFSIKRGLCGTLGLDPGNVRVLQADTGGAFGLKSAVYPEYVMAAYASMEYGKPVMWIETRSENFAASWPGRGMYGKMRITAERDGKVTGLRGEVTTDAGAFGGTSGTSSPFFVGRQLTGPYGIERAHVLAKSVMTNKPPQGPYRGAGRPEAAFFMERMMDLLADELGKDADEVRLANATTSSFNSPLGAEVGASKPFLEEALRRMRYRERSERDKAGLGFFILWPAFSPGESARITVRDRTINVWLGGNAHGQEHYRFVKRLIHEELGVDEGVVALSNGDSDMLEDGVGTWGSRSAIVGGAAVVSCARRVKEQVVARRGVYSPENLLMGDYDAQVFERQSGQLNSFGASLATVSIDEYGVVKALESESYIDVGRALSPEVVKSQVIGGTMQGVGQVLYESIKHDEEGNLVTRDLFDAGLPSTEVIPRITVHIAENPSELPHRAKGLGEMPTIIVPVALVRAIERATGVRIRNTPLLPEDFL